MLFQGEGKLTWDQVLKFKIVMYVKGESVAAYIIIFFVTSLPPAFPSHRQFSLLHRVKPIFIFLTNHWFCCKKAQYTWYAFRAFPIYLLRSWVVKVIFISTRAKLFLATQFTEREWCKNLDQWESSDFLKAPARVELEILHILAPSQLAIISRAWVPLFPWLPPNRESWRACYLILTRTEETVFAFILW